MGLAAVIDHLSESERSRNMAAIKSTDTSPELVVRRIAHSLGYRYRLHVEDLPGDPDLVFPKYGAVVFVNGCFWHQHSTVRCRARPPKSKRSYWLPKLKGNVARDKKNIRRLRRKGWRVMVVWECQTHDQKRLASRLIAFLEK